MIYELRMYHAVPGKLPALNDRFANITLGYFRKYGLKVVGFWTDDVGTSNRLTYMLAFDDAAQRERAWAAFRADPERARAFAETEKDGPLVAHITNTLMRPTSYSPMQ
ncbi:MAG: NIPSNAP family protein [Chloroflexi bacterium]|nr:NIPSNAP family protein [Chloroflexota bacterium]